MDDLMIIELYFERDEKAIKETDKKRKLIKNTDACALLWQSTYWAMTKIRRNV